MQQQVAIGGAVNVQPAPAVPLANVPGQLNNLRVAANNAHLALLIHAGNIQPIKKEMNKILKLLDKIHHALPQAEIDKVYADQKIILENLLNDAAFTAAQLTAFYTAFETHKTAHTAMANYSRNIRHANPIAQRELRSKNPDVRNQFRGNIMDMINKLISDKKEIMTNNGAVETKDGFLTSTNAKALAAVIAAMGGPVVLGKKGDSPKVLAEVYRILKDEYNFQHPISISPDVNLGMKGFIRGPYPIRSLTSGPEVQRISLIEQAKPNVFNKHYYGSKTERLAQTFLRLDNLAYTFVGTNFSRWDVIRNEAKTAQEKFDLAVEIAARKEVSLLQRQANDPDNDTTWSRAEFIKVFRGVFKSNKLPRVSTFVPREQRGQFDALMPGFDAAVDARKRVLLARLPGVPAAPVVAGGAIPPGPPPAPGGAGPAGPPGGPPAPGGAAPAFPIVPAPFIPAQPVPGGGAAPHMQPVVPGAEGQQPEFHTRAVPVGSDVELARAVDPVEDSALSPDITGTVQGIESNSGSDPIVPTQFTERVRSQSPQSEDDSASSTYDASEEDDDSSNQYRKK